MSYLLTGLGIIAVFAFLFWLDRYYKNDDEGKGDEDEHEDEDEE